VGFVDIEMKESVFACALHADPLVTGLERISSMRSSIDRMPKHPNSSIS